MRNNRKQIRRHWFSAFALLSAPGSIDAVETFTATFPMRIRGWCVSLFFYQPSLLGVSASARAYAEITRATARATDYGLDTEHLMIVQGANIAGIENVGTTGGEPKKLERHMTPNEADELGLLLDYGESIRAIVNLVTILPGTCRAYMEGWFFYEEA